MNTIWIVIPILLVLMFLLGTELNKEAFVNVVRHPKAVIMERTRVTSVAIAFRRLTSATWAAGAFPGSMVSSAWGT